MRYSGEHFQLSYCIYPWTERTSLLFALGPTAASTDLHPHNHDSTIGNPGSASK